MSAINELTGTLYSKLPLELLSNIYSYSNPVIDATNDIVNSREFVLASDKIRLRKFVVAICERMNQYYNTQLTIDDVEDYYIEDDDSNENEDEKIVGVGKNMELYFKAEAIERERERHGHSNVLPNTRKFVVFVENYSTHRTLLKDYYEDRLHEFTYEHIKEYFGDSFTMRPYIYKKATSRMDDEDLSEFHQSIIEMMLENNNDYYMEDFIWESIGYNEDNHSKKYNAGVYYGMDGETIVLMDCPEDMVIEEDGVPEYYIVPTEM
jgi:hypothetical protein